MSIKNRIGRLEDRYGGRPCLQCGQGGDSGDVPIEVSYAESDEPEGHKWCPECGKVTVVRISWSDLSR